MVRLQQFSYWPVLKVLTTSLTTHTIASINCESPNTQLDDSIEIIGCLNNTCTRATERGSSISFSCPPGLVPTGPNSSTCIGNGEWEPDPREARYKSECSNNYSNYLILILIYTVNCGQPPPPPTNGHIIPYFSILEGAVVTYACWNIYQDDNTSVCTEINTTAVCNKNGNWEPASQDLCSVFSGKLYT